MKDGPAAKSSKPSVQPTKSFKDDKKVDYTFVLINTTGKVNTRECKLPSAPR